MGGRWIGFCWLLLCLRCYYLFKYSFRNYSLYSTLTSFRRFSSSFLRLNCLSDWYMLWLLAALVLRVRGLADELFQMDFDFVGRVGMSLALSAFDIFLTISFYGFSMLLLDYSVLSFSRDILWSGTFLYCGLTFKYSTRSRLYVPVCASTMVASALCPLKFSIFLIFSEARISDSPLSLRQRSLSVWADFSPTRLKLVLTKPSKSSQRWLRALSLKHLMILSDLKTKPNQNSLMYLMYMLRSSFSQICLFFSKVSPSISIILRRYSNTTSSFLRTLYLVCFHFSQYWLYQLCSVFRVNSFCLFLLIWCIIWSCLLICFSTDLESNELPSFRSRSEVILDQLRIPDLLQQSFRHLRMRQSSSNSSCLQVGSFRYSYIWLYFGICLLKAYSMKRRIFSSPMTPQVMRCMSSGNDMSVLVY